MGLDKTMIWLRSRMGDGQVLQRSGNALVGTDVASLTPAGHFSPASNNAYDLGLTGTRWRTLYLGTSLEAPLVNATASDTSTTAVSRPVTLTHSISTGTPAAGIGVGMRLRAPSDAGTTRDVGAIDAFHTDPSDGAEVSAVVVRVGDAGTLRETARFVADPSAVNSVVFTASATGEPVVIQPRGGDTNISLSLSGKGTGRAELRASDGSQRFAVNLTGIGFFGQAPVAQGAHIPDVSGGSTVDAEARAAFNTLLAYLRSRGDIAAS